MAAAEFGLSDKTLAGRIRKQGLKPGEDGLFSTKQICDAVFGNLDSEKLRLVKESANEKEIKNRQAMRELVPAAEFLEVIQAGFRSLVAGILQSDLPRDAQDGLIKVLRTTAEQAVNVAAGNLEDDQPEAGV